MTAAVDAGPDGQAAEPDAGPAPASSRPAWAPVPQVNLLPPEILAERRFCALQKRLAMVAGGAVVACVAAVAWAQIGVVSAEDDLALIQAQGSRLQAQQTRYAGVPTKLAELDRVKAARETALASDVAWYRFLSDLAINTPDGTELSSVTIAMKGAQVTATGLPLTPAGLGDVKVSGSATSFPLVAAWLDSVAQVHGLAGSSLSSAAKAEGAQAAGARVAFAGTAVVVPDALSHRYDRKAS